MEYIGIIKRLIFGVILAFCIKSYSQDKINNKESLILGKWICVKHDYSGYNKFSLEQAEKIRVATLNIEKDKYYYSNIEFIESCIYSKFNISSYDTTRYYGYYIEFLYSKKELSKILVYTPVDNEDKPSCFNECATFLLKQDTLINICGGYTFYFLKVADKRKKLFR